MKMKRIIIAMLLLTATYTVNAQDTTRVGNDKPAIYWLYHNNYNLASRYNDYAEAKSALYSLINLEPQNDSLRLNLAYLYFDGRQYPSTILVCMDILAMNPQNPAALQMSAISYEELNIKDKALAAYEKLYVNTENLETLYKVIFLQYDLKRFAECNVNIDIMLASPDLPDATIVMQVTDTEQKEFPLKAAILNIRGLVKKEQGDISGAKKDFNEALELAPDFVFAKESLEELKK